MVSGTWARQRDAAAAIGTKESELSRILAGRIMPGKEWLPALHRAREQATGLSVSSYEQARVFALYMDALQEWEEAAARSASRKPYQQRWARYDLERRLEVEESRLTRALEAWARCERDRSDLDRALVEARRAAAAEEAAARRLRTENAGQRRQLEAASVYVRELEGRLLKSEQLSRYWENEAAALRRQVELLMEEQRNKIPSDVRALVTAGAARRERTTASPRTSSTGTHDFPSSSPRPDREDPQKPRKRSEKQRKRARLFFLYFSPARILTFLLAVTLALVGALAVADPYEEMSVYKSAQLCSASANSDCIRKESGKVTGKDSTTSDDETTYELTFERASGDIEDHDVSWDVYRVAAKGDTVNYKVWREKVIEISVNGEKEEIPPSITTLLLALALLWLSLGLFLWSLIGDGRIAIFTKMEGFGKIFSWMVIGVGIGMCLYGLIDGPFTWQLSVLGLFVTAVGTTILYGILEFEAWEW
ncbi:hypothetical protein ACWCQ1_46825 [Streptomyces sp. NPDC002144]